MAQRVKESGKKRMLPCNGVDTGCDITRRESEPISARSSLTREPEKPRTGGRQMTAPIHAAKAAVTSVGAPPTDDVTWDQIDWHKVTEEVSRLQVRIAKAAQAGRWNKFRPCNAC